MVTVWKPLSYGIFIRALLLMNMHEGQLTIPLWTCSIQVAPALAGVELKSPMLINAAVSPSSSFKQIFISEWLMYASVLLIDWLQFDTNYKRKKKSDLSWIAASSFIRGHCSQTYDWSVLPSLLPVFFSLFFCGQRHSNFCFSSR